MGLETIALVAASVSAATATVTGVMNYEAGQRARSAQEALDAEQAAKIKADQNLQAQNAAKAASMGQNFDRGGIGPELAGGFGFGAGETKTGLGFGRLTG